MLSKFIFHLLQDAKRKNLREGCNCLMGNDVGAYNSCMHLCKYCYANANKKLVLENVKKHKEDSPFLIGEGQKEDTITIANQKSWREENNQLSIF